MLYGVQSNDRTVLNTRVQMSKPGPPSQIVYFNHRMVTSEHLNQVICGV